MDKKRNWPYSQTANIYELSDCTIHIKTTVFNFLRTYVVSFVQRKPVKLEYVP